MTIRVNKFSLFGIVAPAVALLTSSQAHAQYSCGTMQNNNCFVVTADESGYYAAFIQGSSGSAGLQVLADSATSGDFSSNGSYGVYATTGATSGLAAIHGSVGSNFSNGVEGISGNSTTAGVFGSNTNEGFGVYGTAASGYGVYGTGTYGVYGTGTYAVFGTTTTGYGVYGTNGNSNTTGYAGYFNGRVTITGNVIIDGNCNGTTCSSDIRLKKNVQSLSGSLDDLARLRPVTFEWKNPQERGYSSGKQFGFIAQEVEKVKPEWVGVDDQGFKTLNTTSLPVLLVDSVRTLKTENDALRARTAGLEDRIRSLEANRRPMISGVGEGSIGLGLLAVAASCCFRDEGDLSGQPERLTVLVTSGSSS